MNMTITDDLVEAFLKCPTKCFLRSRGEAGAGNAYAAWVRTNDEVFRVAGELLFHPFSPMIPQDSPSCYHSSMRHLVVLFIHFLSTLVRLLAPGGVRSIVAESLLLKHQLLSLANCYFAHNSSVLLFPVFDLSPNHGINRLHERCGCLIDRHVQKAGSRGGASHVPQPFVVGRRDVPRTSSRKVGIGFELPTQSSVVAPNAPKRVDQPHWECGLGD